MSVAGRKEGNKRWLSFSKAPNDLFTLSLSRPALSRVQCLIFSLSSHLRQYQTFRDVLIAPPAEYSDSRQQLTYSISHLTGVGSIWRLTNKIVKKKASAALNHNFILN